MLGALTKFFPVNIKTALVAFLLGFGSAVYVTHVWSEKEAAKQLRDALMSKDAQIEAVKSELQLLRDLDAISYEQIIAEQAKQKQKTKIITKEIVKYVPEETDGHCNFSLGAVGLLNLARDKSGARTVSEATGLSDEALRTPSNHTPHAEIEQHVDCAVRYNELSSRHDALIDWINNRDK